MSTATTPAPTDTGEAADAQPSRDERIKARSVEILAELVRAEQTADRKAARKDKTFQPRTEQHLKAELADTAHKRAKAEVRSQEWTARRHAAWRAMRSDVVTVLHRNRKQLAPWAMAAPFAAAGALGSAAAIRGNAAAISAVFTMVMVGVAWWAWNRGLGTRLAPVSGRVPAKYHRRTRIAAGIALLFVAAMPFHAWDSPHMATPWLVLLATVALTAWPWWRSVAHPIPTSQPPADTPADEPAVEYVPDTLDDQQERVRQFLDAWESLVAADRCPLPDASCQWTGSTDSVDTYSVELPGESNITADKAIGMTDVLSHRLNVPAERLTIETVPGKRRMLNVRYVHSLPAFLYTGPVIRANGTVVNSRWDIPVGAIIDIEVGQYIDGSGPVSYRLCDDSGVYSGFILAAKNVGKSVMLDVIAVGLRKLGCYIIYSDGQDGASSAALRRCADEFYTSSVADVQAMFSRVNGFITARNAELTERDELGGAYQYDPHRPPLILISEECHEVNKQVDPETGMTYGDYFADQLRVMRKCGAGILAASQDLALTTTFGGGPKAEVLRSLLESDGQWFGLRFTANTRSGMLPDGCPSLKTLPKGGFGFKPASMDEGDRPTAMFRVLGLTYSRTRPPQPERGEKWSIEWMQEQDPAQMDERTMTAMNAAQPARGAGASSAQGQTATTPAVPSAPLFVLPGATDANEGPTEADVQAAAVLDREPISDTERDLLHVLGFEGKEWTASYVAGQLGVSRPTATKRLERAAERGLVAKTEAAKWINRKREDEV